MSDGTGASIDALKKFCDDEGKSWDAAKRMVGRLVDGIPDRDEAAALVLKLLQPREAPMSDGPQTVQNALVALEARRKEVSERLASIDKEKATLKAEEKQLDRAAKALRKATGNDSDPEATYECDLCDFASASKQGLAAHKTKKHQAA